MAKKEKQTKNQEAEDPSDESHSGEGESLVDLKPAKIEGRLERLSNLIQNGKTVSVFVLGILGLVLYGAWELKGKELAQAFVIDTMSQDSDVARDMVLDALFELNAERYNRRLAMHESDETGQAIDIIHSNFAEALGVQLNALAQEIESLDQKVDRHANQLSSTIDSWQSFEFYRYFPSRLNDDGVWVADLERPAVSKLEHDIIASPNDNLRLYFFADRNSAGGFRRIDRQAMSGIVVHGIELPFDKVQYEGTDLPIFCSSTGGGAVRQGSGIIQTSASPSTPDLVRLGLLLEEQQPDLEFRFKVFVVSTKQTPRENEC